MNSLSFLVIAFTLWCIVVGGAELRSNEQIISHIMHLSRYNGCPYRLSIREAFNVLAVHNRAAATAWTTAKNNYAKLMFMLIDKIRPVQPTAAPFDPPALDIGSGGFSLEPVATLSPSSASIKGNRLSLFMKPSAMLFPLSLDLICLDTEKPEVPSATLVEVNSSEAETSSETDTETDSSVDGATVNDPLADIRDQVPWIRNFVSRAYEVVCEAQESSEFSESG